MHIKEFEKLYDLHWKKLYAICMDKIHQMEISEEIVQDVFVSLWKRRAELNVISYEDYLVKAVKYKIIDHYRKTRNEKLEVLSIDFQPTLEMQSTSWDYNHALTNLATQELELIIDKLPEQCQRVYRLRRQENLTIKEIAETLSLSEKTVKNHLTKAFSFIRKHIVWISILQAINFLN